LRSMPRHSGSNGVRGATWGEHNIALDAARGVAPVPRVCDCGGETVHRKNVISGTGAGKRIDYNRAQRASFLGPRDSSREADAVRHGPRFCALDRFGKTGSSRADWAQVINLLDPDNCYWAEAFLSTNSAGSNQNVPARLRSTVFFVRKSGDGRFFRRKKTMEDASGVRGAAWVWPL